MNSTSQSWCTGAGGEADDSEDSAPMRYASDESDTDDAMSPASKRRARKAKGRADASSDEEEASPSDAAPRSKARRRGRAKEAVEAAAEEGDDSGKEETEPSDVDMSDCKSEDEAPRKSALGRKAGRAATMVKKKAKQASLLATALSADPLYCVSWLDGKGSRLRRPASVSGGWQDCQRCQGLASSEASPPAEGLAMED